ncbi:MAG: D-glycerate dehydrogenase [Deltaproteobacteria bacterium]|nr:D-glycerate dehydrogenase [Deltaproteobacteria bacterium]
MNDMEWIVHNPSGGKRVIVTKKLPGERWVRILAQADCRVEICTSNRLLTPEEIKGAIGRKCDGVIGQLTEDWSGELFEILKSAGGRVYSNYAVGYNNVDIDAATKQSIPVGNTPGVLTEATAELAVSLTFAAARRIVEADNFMRAGRYEGWLPTLFLGDLLWRKTVGVIGAGRIGAAYARMMIEGHKMNLLYYSPHPNERLEDFVACYGEFLESQGEEPILCKRSTSMNEVFSEADVVSLHPVLNDTTRHMINEASLSLMKENAILVNSSRGALIDEAALVRHCQKHPDFKAALDVYEDEPDMKPGLQDLDMWQRQDVSPFLGDHPPKAAPSIVNRTELDISIYEED